jgi:hypothetical protein
MNVRRLLRKRLADGDIHRRQADDVIDALTDAGFFRLYKPRRFGGYPADLRTVLQVTETLAEADGSAAWVVGIAATGAWAINRGSEQLREEILAPTPMPVSQAAACPARPTASRVASARTALGVRIGSPQPRAALVATVTDDSGQPPDAYFASFPRRSYGSKTPGAPWACVAPAAIHTRRTTCSCRSTG